MTRIARYPRTRADYEKALERWTKEKKDLGEDLPSARSAVKNAQKILDDAEPNLCHEVKLMREALNRKELELDKKLMPLYREVSRLEEEIYDINSDRDEASENIIKIKNSKNFVEIQEYLKEHSDEMIVSFKISDATNSSDWGSLVNHTVPNCIGQKSKNASGRDHYEVARIEMTPKQLEFSLNDGGNGNFSDNSAYTASWGDVEVVYEPKGTLSIAVLWKKEWGNPLRCGRCGDHRGYREPAFACPNYGNGGEDKHSHFGSRLCDGCDRHPRKNPVHDQVLLCKCGKRLVVSEFGLLTNA